MSAAVPSSLKEQVRGSEPPGPKGCIPRPAGDHDDDAVPRKRLRIHPPRAATLDVAQWCPSHARYSATTPAMTPLHYDPQHPLCAPYASVREYRARSELGPLHAPRRPLAKSSVPLLVPHAWSPGYPRLLCWSGGIGAALHRERAALQRRSVLVMPSASREVGSMDGLLLPPLMPQGTHHAVWEAAFPFMAATIMECRSVVAHLNPLLAAGGVLHDSVLHVIWEALQLFRLRAADVRGPSTRDVETLQGMVIYGLLALHGCGPLARCTYRRGTASSEQAAAPAPWQLARPLHGGAPSPIATAASAASAASAPKGSASALAAGLRKQLLRKLRQPQDPWLVPETMLRELVHVTAALPVAWDVGELHATGCDFEGARLCTLPTAGLTVVAATVPQPATCAYPQCIYVPTKALGARLGPALDLARWVSAAKTPLPVTLLDNATGEVADAQAPYALAGILVSTDGGRRLFAFLRGQDRLDRWRRHVYHARAAVQVSARLEELMSAALPAREVATARVRGLLLRQCASSTGDCRAGAPQRAAAAAAARFFL